MYNLGYCNSGNRNSGDYNSGYRNSGYRNSGDYNSGYCNLGDRNSGNRNPGNYNSGDYNSGDYNSGYCNLGDRNSGYGNSGDRHTGAFNTCEPTLMFFNKPTDKSWDEIDHPVFAEFYLNKWVSESDMSDQEKVENSQFHVQGGYLKSFTWEEAWANYWRDSDEDERNRVLGLPNFDAEVFKEITGIDVTKYGKSPCCEGREIEIDGVMYQLKRVSK